MATRVSSNKADKMATSSSDNQIALGATDRHDLLKKILSQYTFKQLFQLCQSERPKSTDGLKLARQTLFLESINSDQKPRRIRRGSVSIRVPPPENIEYIRHPLFPANTTAISKGLSPALSNKPDRLLYAFSVADLMRMNSWSSGPVGNLFDEMLIVQPPIHKVKIDPIILPDFGLTIITEDAGVRFDDVFYAILVILKKGESMGQCEIFNSWEDAVVEVWAQRLLGRDELD